jgi:hypothetical protein
MKTSARRTVGFSRRRGVAYKSSNSLMGGDESIRGTTLSRCCLLVAVFACGAVTRLSWQPLPGQILVRHKSTNSATKTGSYYSQSELEFPLPAVAQEATEGHSPLRGSPYQHGGPG